jgi:hypothetical protein
VLFINCLASLIAVSTLLVASGPVAATAGRGIGLLFVVLGSFVVLISALGFLSPSLRAVEDGLPDGVAHTL